LKDTTSKITYKQLISLLDQRRIAFHNLREKIVIDYPQISIYKDVRHTMILKCVEVLQNTILGIDHIDKQVGKSSWWKSDDCPINTTNDDIRNIADSFEMFIKLAFIHIFFSSIESSFRMLLRSIDPSSCNNATKEFKSIYSALLSKLKLDYKPLLDILTYLRNTIHNNGVYFPVSNKNVSIRYKGTLYVFKIGKPHEYASWPELLIIIDDVRVMMEQIIYHKQISSLSNVVDPYANWYYKKFGSFV